MVEKRDRIISKGIQDEEKEEKFELLGVINVSKTCRLRSLSHTEKAAVLYNSDIEILFTTIVPAVSQVLEFFSSRFSLLCIAVFPPCTIAVFPSTLCDSSWPRQGDTQGQDHPASYIRVEGISLRHMIMQSEGVNWCSLWICLQLYHLVSSIRHALLYLK